MNVSVLSLLAGGHRTCVVSFLFSRYLLEVKIDVVLAKIAVTHGVLWEPQYGHGIC